MKLVNVRTILLLVIAALFFCRADGSPHIQRILMPQGQARMVARGSHPMTIAAGSGTSTWADLDYPELEALATKLGDDRMRIFEWVYNNVETEFYCGCQRGAYLTYLEQAGNDADQCALLTVLLRDAAAHKGISLTTYYHQDTLSLPTSSTAPNTIGIYQWLGVRDQASARAILYYMTAQDEPADTANTMYFQQMWVTAKWSDMTVNFAPSIKPVTLEAMPDGVPVDQLDAANYSLSSIMTAAGSSYNLAFNSALPNTTNIQSYLGGLVATMSPKYHAVTGAGVAGLPLPTTTVFPALLQGGSYPAGLTIASSDSNNLGTGMPRDFTATVSIFLGARSASGSPIAGYAAQDFEAPALAGREVSIYTDSITKKTSFWMAGDPLDENSSNPNIGYGSFMTDSSGTSFTNFEVTFKPAVAFGGTLVDVSSHPAASPSFQATVLLRDPNLPASWVYGFGSSSRRLRLLMRVDASHENGGSYGRINQPGGSFEFEHQYLLGLQYVSQLNEFNRLIGAATGSDLVTQNSDNPASCRWVPTFYSVVVLEGQAPSFRSPEFNAAYIGDFLAPSIQGAVYEPFSVSQLMGSGLESATLRQYTGLNAYSATSSLDYAMAHQNGTNMAYLLTASNCAGDVAAINSGGGDFNDQTYGTNVPEDIEDKVTNQGYEAIVLKSTTASATGYQTYLLIDSNKQVEDTVIYGYLGGVTTSAFDMTTYVSNKWTAEPLNGTNTVAAHPKVTSKEPVDLSNGAYLLSRVDMQCGQAEPKGLRLVRSYNSAMNNVNAAGLGYGWTHSYNITLTQHSPGDMEALSAGADEVLPVILAARVIENVLRSDMTAKGWMTAVSAAAWATEQSVNSRTTLTMGDRALDFIRMPDGSYHAPSCIDATLTLSSDGTSSVAFRNFNTIQFNSDGKFTSISDPYGNSLTAQYTGGYLSSVSDCYNQNGDGKQRTFTFHYTGSALTSVTDNSTPERTVTYNQTGNCLNSVVDTELNSLGNPENRSEEYTYVSNSDPSVLPGQNEAAGSFLLKQVTDNLGRVIVTNSYDLLGMVVRQQSYASQSTSIWTLGVAAGMAMETDPDGNVRQTYFDRRGRDVFAVNRATADTTNIVGDVFSWTYDGADHILTSVLPSSGSKAGTLDSHVFSYDGNDNMVEDLDSLGNALIVHYDAFFRPDYILDRNGQKTKYAYTDGIGRGAAANAAAPTEIDITDPGSLVTKCTFDSTSGDLTALQYPWDTTAIQFSAFERGMPTTVSYPTGGSDSFSYDCLSRLKKYVDRNLATVSYDYDTRGHILH